MMKSSRITQLLLAALVDTQILNLIHFIGALGRYESPESASRACHRWADSAGQYSIRNPWDTKHLSLTHSQLVELNASIRWSNS